MAGKIFINYRRGDDPGFAQALFGRLEQAFGHDRLFMDVDSIEPGFDFVQVLKEQVDQCDILISIIGHGWVDALDEQGARRLCNPNDFVRIEIKSALASGKRVIPVLVGQANMPRAEQVPDTLKPLVRRNAVRLTHERFRSDTQGLIAALQRALSSVQATPKPASTQKSEGGSKEAKNETAANVASVEHYARQEQTPFGVGKSPSLGPNDNLANDSQAEKHAPKQPAENIRKSAFRAPRNVKELSIWTAAAFFAALFGLIFYELEPICWDSVCGTTWSLQFDNPKTKYIRFNSYHKVDLSGAGGDYRLIAPSGITILIGRQVFTGTINESVGVRSMSGTTGVLGSSSPVFDLPSDKWSAVENASRE